MKTIHLILVLLLSLSGISQETSVKFNLDFEHSNDPGYLPDGWIKWGYYDLKIDTIIAYSGKNSVKITSDQDNPFGSIAYSIPANYLGRNITLTGFMKIKDVEDGHAGLLMRIDDKKTSIEFDNMNDREITGTHDWKEYSITLPLSKKAKTIYVAGLLTGKGQAWFDDFSVSIDGKDIQSLKPISKSNYKATLDTVFDNGSEFHIVESDSLQLLNLYKLGKVWGFLKYHHPEIAKGDINWDYELFRILPVINSDGFENEIYNWISNTGDLNKKRKKFKELDIKIKPDTEWISDIKFLSDEICFELVKIQNSKPEKEHYYIDFAKRVRNPVFKNENSYESMHWGDTGYKILALFRYWNMIEYFFPNKYLIEKDWDDVLKEYLPKIIDTKTELEYKLVILSLIGEIHDTHANIWSLDEALSNFFGTKIAPVEIGYVDYKFIVVRIFDQLETNSKISIGDEIIRIDGVGVDNVYANKIDYCPASNEPTMMRDLSKKMLRTNGDYLAFTFKKVTGEIKTEWLKTVPTWDINFYSTDNKSHKIIEGDIGYIYPAKLEKGEIHDIMKEFIDKKAIIVDFRCYPSDFIVFSMGEYLNPKPIEFVKFSQGSLETPGQFSFTKPMKVGKKNKDYYKGKVIILINEKTQSSAEYTTMSLRASPNATVIGSTTAGADGNVSEIYLPGGIRTMISGIGVYYPDGTETQRIGIVPDILVKPTIQGIIDGRDEVLEKAIEEIEL